MFESTMGKSRRLAALAGLFGFSASLFIAAATLNGQSAPADKQPATSEKQGEKPPADKPARPALDANEKKAACDKLQAYLKNADGKKSETMYADLEQYLGKLAKEKKFDTLLRFPDLLSELFRGTIEVKKTGLTTGRRMDNKNEESAAGKTIKNEYSLWVPRSYAADKSWPIILCLPPAKVSGQQYFDDVYSKHDGFKNDYIIACPSLQDGNFSKHEKGQPPEEPGWFTRPGLWQCLSLTLKDVMKTYNVDPNRVFLDGYGEGGGDAVFQIGSSFIDVFAGVIARSAAPPGSVYLANLKHIPVYSVVSDNADPKLRKAAADASEQAQKLDLKGYTFKGKGVPGKDKGLASENDGIFQWLSDKKRVLYPQEIELFANAPEYGRAYWIQIKNMELGPDHRAHIKASYDRETNKINITSENIYTFDVMLNDEIVDMDKQFEIHAKPFASSSETGASSDPKFTGKKERSLRSAIQRFHLSGDSARVFLNSVEIALK